jgi:hypothetical protein
MNTNYIQAIFEADSRERMNQRATTQMTLGKLIDRLKEMDPYAVIQTGLTNPHSYRGYYSDLAFEQGPPSTTVAYVLALCQSAMGEVFTGYKGGDFQMGRNTPVWVANYGSCGMKLMTVNDDGSLMLENDD